MLGSPAFLLRQKMILKNCGAISEDSAKALEEAGVFNPNAFAKITDDFVHKRKIAKTAFHKYYLIHREIPTD